MTKDELEKATGQELIDARDYCGVDGYYRDYLENVNAEMLKRFNRLAELERENAELKAKDNARAQITQMAFEEGFNLECMESPEEGIDSFLECYPQYDRFDLDGNMRR